MRPSGEKFKLLSGQTDKQTSRQIDKEYFIRP